MNEKDSNKIKEIFSANGTLSSCLPGYEYRNEQFNMATEVLKALRDKRHLIVEAGTGVGKSLAYLIPLCLWLEDREGSRVIVSTYTKALQKQLYEKELPFIKKHFFPQLKYALSFGSENYLCLRRLGKTKQHGLFDVEEKEDISFISRWLKETATGLRNEINIRHSTWQKVKREIDLCFGKKCDYYHECFYQTAKVIERRSNIIVSNHHLYFAHVASDYNVLPEAPCVVFDEAHEIEEVASDYLGIMVSNTKLKYLLDSIISSRGKGLLMRLKWLDPVQIQELSKMVEKARRTGEKFFLAVRTLLGNNRSIRLFNNIDFGEEVLEALTVMTDSIERLVQVSGDEEEEKEISTIAKRGLIFRENIRNIVSMEHPDHVYWASTGNSTIKLTATPLNISDILRHSVFDTLSTSILTSATLSVGREFNFTKKQLGLHDAETALFSTPFDLKQQMAIYIPHTMPEPNDKEFPDAVAKQLENVLYHAKGNSLVLFTSYALLNEVAEKLSIDYPILKQGDTDNFLLLQKFINNQPAVLFGTYAFWQGIDLPGDILKCVVITKLPFAVPTEPVIEAKMEKIRSEGGTPFYELQVPGAVITFRQGLGRLIRSKTDTGVVVLLDSRIVKKPYGRYFISSLPEVNMVDDINDVLPFLNQDI